MKGEWEEEGSNESVDVSTSGIKYVDKMGRDGHAPAISKPAKG